MECVVCGKSVKLPKRGPVRRTCSNRCRVKLHRLRAADPVPTAMRDLPRWARADGKRPVTPQGCPASSTDPETWTTYGRVQSGVGDGFGFMCGDGIGVIDLDHCIGESGEVSGLAQRILDSNPGAYVECSVSGAGLHVWGLLDESRGIRRDGFEVYSWGRFVRSGDVFRHGDLLPLKF